MELLPWEPDKVICSEGSLVLFSPEDVQKAHGPVSSKTLLKCIAVRNLSRRIISECCSERWQPAAK